MEEAFLESYAILLDYWDQKLKQGQNDPNFLSKSLYWSPIIDTRCLSCGEMILSARKSGFRVKQQTEIRGGKHAVSVFMHRGEPRAGESRKGKRV